MEWLHKGTLGLVIRDIKVEVFPACGVKGGREITVQTFEVSGSLDYGFGLLYYPPTLGGVLGEGEDPLPFSLRGGVGGVSRLRFPSRSPPPKQPFQEVCEKAPRAPSPLETWPTGPWGLDPATFTILTSCGANPWVRVSKP